MPGWMGTGPPPGLKGLLESFFWISGCNEIHIRFIIAKVKTEVVPFSGFDIVC